VEEGSGEREDPSMPNGNKYRRTEANIYFIECRSGGEAGGRSGVSRRRSQKAEAAIGKKIGWSRFIRSNSDKLEPRRDVKYPKKGTVWRFEERDSYRDGGSVNRNDRKDGRRPS
jgi:hypothetical protein